MRAVHYKNAVQGCNFCMDTMLSLLAHTKEDFFMLYNVVVNDWGETTYVPTALGNVLLVVVLIALLAVAVVFARKQRNKTGADDVDQKMAHGKLTVKQLAFCAMAIALGTVLSNIKLFHFPTGGSITLLSMLVIVDYILAFGALGLSGLFSNAKFGLLKGYITAVLGRYVFAVISGWIFFGAYAWEGWDPLPYSLAYNAIYIFAEAAVTLLILSVKPVQNLFSKLKQMALND